MKLSKRAIKAILGLIAALIVAGAGYFGFELTQDQAEDIVEAFHVEDFLNTDYVITDNQE